MKIYLIDGPGDGTEVDIPLEEGTQEFDFWVSYDFPEGSHNVIPIEQKPADVPCFRYVKVPGLVRGHACFTLRK